MTKIINAADSKYDPTPDYPSRLHNAWEDIRSGGTGDALYLPYDEQRPNQYKLLPGLPLVLDKQHAVIYGDGLRGYGITAASKDDDCLIIAASDIHIHDLFIGRYWWQESGGSELMVGEGSGIQCRMPEPIGGLRLERVAIECMGMDGIRFNGEGNQGYQVSPVLRDVSVMSCGRWGIFGKQTNAAEANVNVNRCGEGGLWLDRACGGHWHVTAHSHKGAWQVDLLNCEGVELRGYFEDYTGAIQLSKTSGCLLGGWFGAYKPAASVRFQQDSIGNTLASSRHWGYNTAKPQVTEDGTAWGNVIMPQTGAEVKINRWRNRVW